MSEDYTKVLEQNVVLEEIIKRILGGKDEVPGEGYYESGNEDSGDGNPEDANSADIEAASDKYRIELYQALADKNLVIPIHAFSSEEDGDASDEPITVEPITQISPTGDGEAIMAFTSVQNLQSRMGSCEYIICDTGTIFSLVLQGDFKALVINPGVSWVGISAVDIRTFFRIEGE